MNLPLISAVKDSFGFCLSLSIARTLATYREEQKTLSEKYSTYFEITKLMRAAW